MTLWQEQSGPSGGREEAARWVARESLGALGPDDRRRFNEWLAQDAKNRSAYEAARSVVISLDGAETIFRQAHGRDENARAGEPQVRRWQWAALTSCAAAVVAVVLFSVDIAALKADYHASPGEVRSLILPDGSKAVLDTRSAINLKYSTGTRDVELVQGRAYFEVAHGDSRPFTVHVLGGEARDIGTAFIVRRTGENADVLVTEGQVEVTSNGGRATLGTGQGASWTNGGAPARLPSFSTAEALGWRESRLTIDHQPLGRVVGELNRYRRAPIILANRAAANRLVSGVVQTDLLTESLASLAAAQGLKVLSLPFVTVLY